MKSFVYYVYVGIVFGPRAPGKFSSQIRIRNLKENIFRFNKHYGAISYLSFAFHNGRLVLFPSYDHRPRASTALLGLLLRRFRAKATKILPYVQCFQTRTLPSLFIMQQMCAQHGPSLPVDQQLRGILEQKVLHVAVVLRPHDVLFHR